MTRTANALPARLGLICLLALPCLLFSQTTGDPDGKPATTQSDSTDTTTADQAGTAAVTHAHPASHTHAPTEAHGATPKTTSEAKPQAATDQDLSLPEIEQTALKNLATAIELAHKMAVAAPAGWQGTDQKDENIDAFATKQNDLQRAFNGASTPSAQAQALAQTTTALTQVLAAIEANPGAATSPALEGRGGTGVLGKLPLYLASIALIVSLLALWRGWLLARREVEKALADAGLL